LRADFREYYSLSFDASYANSRVETADLVVGLPAGSRTMSAIDPKAAWGWNEALLAQIWNLLSAYIFYQDTKNKHKDAPKIEPPKKKVEKQSVADTHDVKEILKKKRKES
jgi:hypothetical protein